MKNYLLQCFIIIISILFLLDVSSEWTTSEKMGGLFQLYYTHGGLYIFLLFHHYVLLCFI